MSQVAGSRTRIWTVYIALLHFSHTSVSLVYHTTGCPYKSSHRCFSAYALLKGFLGFVAFHGCSWLSKVKVPGVAMQALQHAACVLALTSATTSAANHGVLFAQ